jgi:hypothetical protein
MVLRGADDREVGGKGLPGVGAADLAPGVLKDRGELAVMEHTGPDLLEEQRVVLEQVVTVGADRKCT